MNQLEDAILGGSDVGIYDGVLGKEALGIYSVYARYDRVGGHPKLMIKRIEEGHYEVHFGFSWTNYSCIGVGFYPFSMLGRPVRIANFGARLWLTLADIIRVKDGKISDASGETTAVEVREVPQLRLSSMVESVDGKFRPRRGKYLRLGIPNGNVIGDGKFVGTGKMLRSIRGGIIAYSDMHKLFLGIPENKVDMVTDYFDLAREEIAHILALEENCRMRVEETFRKMMSKPV